MPDPKLLILTALSMEAKAIERALGPRENVEIRVIGIGAKRLPHFESNSYVIVAGLAGGLDPSLKTGDVVLDPGDLEHPKAAGWPSRGFDGATSWHLGRIHTTSRILCTPEDKARIFRETTALAADMEQAHVRESVAQGVRVIGLRAISDPADFALDPAVLGFVNEFGRPRPLRVLGRLLLRPRLLPHLRELNSNCKLALHQLGLAARALVETLND